jgi:hypothetical protein
MRWTTLGRKQWTGMSRPQSLLYFFFHLWASVCMTRNGVCCVFSPVDSLADITLGSLLVKHLRPVSWNKKAFDQLVLDPVKKELIEAMVRMHMSSNMSTGVIESKGKSLIILLHGGPGTGKTLTAESVAELVERPLYRVMCGDIGTEPESVERYLESVLYIRSIWQAGETLNSGRINDLT